MHQFRAFGRRLRRLVPKQALGWSIDGRGWRVGCGGDDDFFDENENLIDYLQWPDGDAPDGSSFGRFPDGDENLETMSAPSQGTTNVGN